MEWDCGVAPESSSVARVKPRYGPFIDGSVVDGSGTQATGNPATGGPLADVGTAGPAEVDRAVAAGRGARDGAWGAMAGPARARLLFRVAGAVARRARELAVLETLDTGRPVRVTGDVDLPLAVAHLQACAGWADKLGYAGQGPDPRPVGVVGVLVESRTPLLATVRRVAPALACGNTVVLVPDPDAPVSALVLAEAAAEAGLPAGALNVLPAADAVAGHAGLDAVTVTGSSGTCRDVARSLAGSGCRLAVEADGRTVHVVHDDAPLDQAVDGVVDGLGTDQQVLVAEAVAEEFGELLRERLSRLRVGDPLDRNTDVGPVGTAARRALAEALVAAADEEGAHRVTSPAALPDRGLFLAPTLFTDVAPSMRLAREEVTGPLASVLTFRTPAEAVATATVGRPVRAAAVWTDKGSRALWTARNLRAGVVWVNAVDRSDPAAPSGGAMLADYLGPGGHLDERVGREPPVSAPPAPAPPIFPVLVGGRLRRAVGSRGDVADAVVAARAALPGWSGASAHQRGRVLYGVAELLDAQRHRFAPDVSAELVDAAVDRWVWFAGWTDKIAGMLGSVNPVAGPYASWSAPRPIGVVGALAPGSLLGLVDVLAPVLATGSTAVVVAERAQTASSLAELLAVAELPAGVTNLLTGDVAELAPELGRAGVDGLDLGDAPIETAPELVADLERAAARTLTRVLPPRAADDAGLARLRGWSELTTVWHPIGR